MLTKTEIEKYFNAEKNESLLFIILGITAIVLAIIFFFYLKTNWHKGAAIPLLIVGVVQLIVGTIVYKRSDHDRIKMVYAYDMNPVEIKNKELPRMEKVNKNFVIYRYGEFFLLLTGLGLFFYFKQQTDKIFWVGLTVSLIIESAICLGADYFAEKRGLIYMQQLKSFVTNKGLPA